jgi:hypothetical protein
VTNESPSKHFPLLIGTGVFAMLWTIARASVQSVAIDEADTYLTFVAPAEPRTWAAAANNHVLNTLLMRLVTQIFGVSAFTLRIPALIGAALYIVAAYWLVRLISPRRALQWALLACLTLNPLVMDYLVAARGYSLAMAFLLWMAVIVARYQGRDAEARKGELWSTCVLLGVSAALSVCANFAFAIADALTALGLLIWICREHRRDYLRIAAAAVLPGIAVLYGVAGPVILNWSKGQLTWGANSLLQMFTSLLHASLFDPNEYLLHPQLRHYFVHFGTFLYPLLAAFAIWRAVMLLLETPADGKEWRVAGPVAVICGSAWLAAVICHEFLLLVYGIPLPLDRTALWVALLFLIGAGALAAPRLPSLAGRISGEALTAILVVIGCYNLVCPRLTYFNEWKYDADMKNVYGVLASYNHTGHSEKVSANWRYVAALNCYRLMSGGDSFEKIPAAPSTANDYPTGYQAYVVFYPVDKDFVNREGLKVVYSDEFSGVAVAIRPEVATK